nr:MAG TPA: hypothetical protein [Herelleviridae sp.]
MPFFISLMFFISTSLLIHSLMIGSLPLLYFLSIN